MQLLSLTKLGKLLLHGGSQDKIMKEQNNNLLKAIRIIVNEIDPENFRPGQIDGTPEDEYDIEIQMIHNFILHNQEEIKLNSNILSDYINKTWLEYFGSDCAKLSEITSRIYKIII